MNSSARIQFIFYTRIQECFDSAEKISVLLLYYMTEKIGAYCKSDFNYPIKYVLFLCCSPWYQERV